MSGIMRAPTRSAYFEIPYSGKSKRGDCIIIVTVAGNVSIAAYHASDIWSHEDYITDFSDENNVISFFTNKVLSDGAAALIPGPNHV